RIAGEHAVRTRLADALVDGRDVFLRNRTADDRIDELVALARLERLELDPDMAVLTAAAGLTDELAFLLDRAANRLAVSDLRLAHIRFDLELALQAVDDDLEMQLAHAGDDRLPRFGIRRKTERGIFLRKPLQRHAHLFLVGLRLRLDRDGNHRLREVHLLELNDVLRIAQRIAGHDVFEADGRSDVSGPHLLDLVALVRMHLQQAPDALLLVLAGVRHRVARPEHAGIHPEERQVTDERVVEDLERERGELLVIARLARHFGAVERKPLDRRHFDRRRHVLDDGVQHRLHALVLECRTAHAQYDFVANRALAQAALDLGLRQRLALEILV